MAVANDSSQSYKRTPPIADVALTRLTWIKKGSHPQPG
ncbi:glutamine synthetase [Bradyrhizobium sp. LM2.7]